MCGVKVGATRDVAWSRRILACDERNAAACRSPRWRLCRNARKTKLFRDASPERDDIDARMAGPNRITNERDLAAKGRNRAWNVPNREASSNDDRGNGAGHEKVSRRASLHPMSVGRADPHVVFSLDNLRRSEFSGCCGNEGSVMSPVSLLRQPRARTAPCLYERADGSGPAGLDTRMESATCHFVA